MFFKKTDPQSTSASLVDSDEKALAGYFAHVASFKTSEGAFDRKSARVAWTVAGVAVLAATASMIAVAALTPLKTVETRIFRVDNTTGAVERVFDLKASPLASNEATNRFLVWQYVRLREGYVPTEVKASYETVSQMSAPAVQTQYYEATRGSNPDSPQVRLGPNGVASVRWVSTAFLENKLAQVRFVVTETKDGVVSPPRAMVATIGFDFTEGKKSAEELNSNPLGFTVASYHADAEAGQ